MGREVVKPQAPQLITDVSRNRIAVLVECFQVTKNADYLVSDASRFGISDSFRHSGQCAVSIGRFKAKTLASHRSVILYIELGVYTELSVFLG